MVSIREMALNRTKNMYFRHVYWMFGDREYL